MLTAMVGRQGLRYARGVPTPAPNPPAPHSPDIGPADETAAERLLGALRRYWGYDSFRPLQQEAMTCVVEGRESVVVLPTGGGKSLCFQAPAVCLPGTAVVVSPLISLMKDQVDALRECGIPAAAVNSSLSPEERRDVADRARSGELKLLYMAPERLLTDGALSFLTTIDVSLIAIDEAHCISSWGHDFRPEYRGLRRLREVLPGVAMHAYTATATERVRHDIAQQLGLGGDQGDGAEMLIGSFDRPNLSYRVQRAKNKIGQIADAVGKRKGESGIVYCISRKEVERTAEALAELGVRALPYHAGLADEVRQRNQEAFIQERADVIVATVAFGMGIDKSNVRYVVHAGLPKSIENYQQESGRAGRDGLEADCLLLYSAGDAQTWRRMTDMSDPQAAATALAAIDAMSGYASGVTCRRRALLSHFGEGYAKDNCASCDVCLGDLELVEEPLILAQKIISCVARLEQRFGGDYTAKVLAGSSEQRILDQRHDRLSTYGLLSDSRPAAIRDWIEQLVGQGFLAKEGEYNTLHITETGRRLLKGDAAPQLLKPAARKAKSQRQAAGADNWEGVDRDLFERLRTMRAEIATTAGVPAYVVFGDAALRDMARRRPSTLDGFAEVRGVGQKKLAEYGERFVAAIVDHCEQTGAKLDALGAPAPTPATRTDDAEGPSAAALACFGRFRNGESIDDVSAALSRARSTVVGYLNQYLRHEQITDPAPWVNAAHARRVEEAIEQVGLRGLKPIFEQLGGEVDYDAIRIVATCVANRE
ncbi:MAG: DNA helicase RecQ [Planctomycetota bacterium]